MSPAFHYQKTNTIFKKNKDAWYYFFQFFKHFWFPLPVRFLLLKSLKIFTVGKILQLSADHHAGWPLCKLWEHCFSVPDLGSSQLQRNQYGRIVSYPLSHFQLVLYPCARLQCSSMWIISSFNFCPIACALGTCRKVPFQERLELSLVLLKE